MATAKKKSSRTATAKSTPVLIHEVNEKGFHRIVSITDGKSKYGDYVAHNSIAVLDNLRAATGHYADTLPQGIFKTSQVDHTTLS